MHEGHVPKSSILHATTFYNVHVSTTMNNLACAVAITCKVLHGRYMDIHVSVIVIRVTLIGKGKEGGTDFFFFLFVSVRRTKIDPPV